MKVKLLGKIYSVVFKPLKDARGYCDPPDQRNKTIWIDSSLTDEEQLEVILHELIHAVDWPLSEEFCEARARDIARVLWRLGYRRSEPT